MPFYVVDSPFSSSLGNVTINQGTYLDPEVEASGVLHASGYDAAALDFDLDLGATVLSMADGVIVDVHDSELDGSGGSHGFGNYVTVRHTVTPISGGAPYSFFATYAHIDGDSLSYIKFALSVWQSYGFEMPVSAGDTLGLVGDAGYGIHLHVQFGMQSTSNIPGILIADARETLGNTSLLNSLMLSGSLIGPGGLTVGQVLTGDSVRSLNVDTGDIPGQYSPNGTGGGGAPDLTVTGVELASYGASPGSDIQVSFSIGNLGDVATATSRGEIVISSSRDFSGTVYVLDTFNVSALDQIGGASSVRHYTETVTIPTTLGRTTYYVGVRVDSTSLVAELNEANNFAVAPPLAVGGGLSGDPDLRVGVTSFPDGVHAPGDQVTVTFTISADGDGAPPYTYRVYYSEDDTLGPDDLIVHEETTARGLGYIGTHYYSLNLEIPASADTGVGYFFVQADPNNALVEQREDNNVRSRPLLISADQADPDALADLFADLLYIPAVIEAGEQFRYAAEYANISADDAVPTTVYADGTYAYRYSLVMSVDAIISTDDRVLHSSIEYSGAPGTYHTNSSGQIITLPSDVEDGYYYFSLVLDYGQQVLEENEANNISPPVLVQVVNNIPASIVANDDALNLLNVPAKIGNVFSNDVYQIFSTPVVDRVNGGSSLVGVEIVLTSGARLIVNADGSYSLNADDVLALMPVGTSVVDTLTYRARGVNGDFSTATITITLERRDPGNGTVGNDSLLGTMWNDRISGLGGNDTITGLTGADTLNGGDGNDSLYGGDGNDALTSGLGNDLIDAGLGTDRGYFTGTTAATVNLLLITAQVTGYGTDTLLGVEHLSTGSGNDRLTGNNLGNSLISGAGSDTVNGGSGNDSLYGGDGNDSLTGGIGNDRIDGGAGIDRAYFTGTVGATVDLTLTTAQNTGHGTDTILNVEHVSSGTGNDRLTGNTLGNSLISGDGNDALSGGIGNDALYGGAGNDLLTGGTGKDAFIFNATLGGGNVDNITDFSVIDDTIRLDDTVFAGLFAGTLGGSAFAANLTGNAADAQNRLIFETDTGRLYFDADGSGALARVHFATLAANLALTNADFFVF